MSELLFIPAQEKWENLESQQWTNRITQRRPHNNSDMTKEQNKELGDHQSMDNVKLNHYRSNWIIYNVSVLSNDVI